MKKNLKVTIYSALAIVGMVCGLASCGPDVDPEPEGPVSLEAPSIVLSELDDQYKLEAKTAKNFGVYLVRDEPVKGTPNYISTKNGALVEGGTKAKVYAYGIPEGYNAGVTVVNSKEELATEVQVATDGTLTFPVVENPTSYKLYLYGVENVAEGVTAKSVRKSVELTVVPSSMFAKNGYFDFTGRNGQERTVMSAEGERYLWNNGLAPINTTSNGSYQLYSERLHSPLLDQEKYVPGFGYGILDYGTIDAPLAAEATEEFKWYLHDQLDATADEGNFNYLNSNSNSVSTLYSYISQSYFGTYLNEDMTSSEYGFGLSRESAPEAVNPDENGASDTWKIYLRVGGESDGPNGVTKNLSYRTASKDPEIAKFDKAPIKLEDYLTPFKLLATQATQYYRGAEQAGESTANRQISGYAEFFNESKDLTDLPSDEEFMSKVGVKIDHSDNSITIKFNGKIAPDYAEYQLNGLWSNPVSEDFLRVIGNGNALEGAKNHGVNVSGKGLSPLDTMLSVGPYYTKYYESKKTIAYASNEEWPLRQDPYGRPQYQIKGVHLNVNSALSTNKLEYLQKFEAGLTDSSNIPQEAWDKYATSPRRKKVEGSSFNGGTFLNTYDQATWELLFPDSKEAAAELDYTVKPMLADKNFYKGLQVGIDREALAEYGHNSVDSNIQEPIARSTPKATLYNESPEHKAVKQEVFGNTLDDSANWKSNAADYFELAIEEELAAGHYTLGTEANPTVVDFQIRTVDAAKINFYNQNINQNWKDAFELAVTTHREEDNSNPWVGPNGKPLITLSTTMEVVPQTSDSQMQDDLLYNGVKAGLTDGQNVYSVTGNPYDTFNNLEKYKSDDSNGFTLGFGIDTNVVSQDLFYDNKYWGFDALWDAGNVGVLLDEYGHKVSEVTYDDGAAELDVDTATKEYTAKFPFSHLEEYVSDLKFMVDTIDSTGFESYKEDAKAIYEDGFVTLHFSGDAVIDGALLGAAYADYHYLDWSAEYTFKADGVTKTKSVGGYWLVPKQF